MNIPVTNSPEHPKTGARMTLCLTLREFLGVIISLGLVVLMMVPDVSSFLKACFRSLLEDVSTSWMRSALRASLFFSRNP